MAHPYYFLCPICFREDTLSRERCRGCETPFRIDAEGLWMARRCWPPQQYRREVLDTALVLEARRPDAPTVLRRSGPARLFSLSTPVDMTGFRRWFHRRLYGPHPTGRGYLDIERDRLVFRQADGRSRSWHPDAVTAITTNSHYLLMTFRGDGAYQVAFERESALKYEILLRRWISERRRRNGTPPLLEFQPRLRHQPSRPPRQPLALAPPRPAPPDPLWERFAMGGVALLVRLLSRSRATVTVHGREHWDDAGRGFVIANHQSAVDPFLIGAFIDRRTAFLTKSLSFAHTLPRGFLRLARGLPTTRWQSDPAVIAIVRRVLSHGVKVGIFPEGERTWSGELLPFRLSVVKLLMAAREPITLVAVCGAFGLWPRWAARPRPARVALVVCPSFCLLAAPWTVDEQRRWLEERFQSLIDAHTPESLSA